jgi:hypothetical protein
MYLMQDPDPTEVVNPDDIRIRRVYTRPTGQLAPDETISATVLTGNDIVVEWEAGSAANRYYGGPNTLQIEIVIYDVNGVANLAAPLPVVVNTDGANRTGTYQQDFPIVPPFFVAGNTYEITAILFGPTPPAGAFQAAFAKCMCYAY